MRTEEGKGGGIRYICKLLIESGRTTVGLTDQLQVRQAGDYKKVEELESLTLINGKQCTLWPCIPLSKRLFKDALHCLF